MHKKNDTDLAFLRIRYTGSEKNNLLSETAAEDEESENCIGGFEDDEDNFPDEKSIYCFVFI